MAIISLDKGIEITVPDDYEVSERQASPKMRSPGLRSSGIIAMPTDSGQTHNNDLLIKSLEKSGLELLSEVELHPKPQAAMRRGGGATATSVAEFKVDLTQNEEAVLLVEQDGMYLWKYANESHPASAVRRRGARREATDKRVVFRVEIAASPEPTSPITRRGAIKDFVWGRVKAYVLKFTAGAAVDLAKKILERNVSNSLVRITSTSPGKWEAIDNLKILNLPSDRPARILLLVHGTFSSTVGAFGPLGGTPWGQSLLMSALNNYDAVIGFNHPTLSEDPLENAKQLLSRLRSVDWRFNPTFDVIAHSRGGLVIRSLIERLLPKSGWQAKFNRVVFVACTNEGTILAEPENWESLVNLYTNLAVGACRVLGLITPQSLIVTAVLADMIESIGTFVKYCADSAVTDRVVPGLSAMKPDGDFIKEINLFQEGQPAIADSFYYAITSDFKPQLTGDHDPKEIPKRFFEWLAGGFMARLMLEPNDLVVNTKSMGAIDAEVGNYVKERYDFGENPQVYHTNYFTRPEVANALARWLRLPPSLTSFGVRPTRLRGSSQQPSSPSTLPLTTQATPATPLPPSVDTDIILANATSPIKALREKIAEHAPSYVVVRKSQGDRILNYAFTGEEVLEMTSGNDDQSISESLKLREGNASGTQIVGDDIRPKPSHTQGAAALTVSRDVVLAGDVPVGVVPEKKGVPGVMELVEMANVISQPKSNEERIAFRRAMPTFTVTNKDEAVTISDVAADTTVTCYFHAEMDAEVIVNRATTLVVTVSREVIEAVMNVTSATGMAEAITAKRILIQIIPRSNFIVIDESDGRAEIEVPQPGKPREVFFDLRAIDEGDGEIWVVARQGQVPMLKLILKPRVVKTRKLSLQKVVAEQAAREPKPLSRSLHQLWIQEHKSEDGFVYKYELYSEELKIRRWLNSSPITGDREKYVAGLYEKIEERWISSGQDINNFSEELRAYGVDLLDQLIPAELQQLLWDYRDDFDSIQVISTEPFIPWELVHLRDPNKRGMPGEVRFLGQMGLIRWLEGAGENGWPPEQIRLRNGRARYVIPEYPHPDYKLPEAEKEWKFLEENFAATGVTPESGEVRKIISKPGEFDLLHIACHGVAEAGDINDAKLLMQGRVEDGNYILDPFYATVAAKYCDLKSDDNTPMVVLNACQAGRAGYKLTGIGGFTDAFLSGGAGAFVGTLWSVGDSPARTFVEALYRALLNGDNLSEATIEARKAAQAAGEATWLAYVVYGNPHMTIRTN